MNIVIKGSNGSLRKVTKTIFCCKRFSPVVVLFCVVNRNLVCFLVTILAYDRCLRVYQEQIRKCGLAFLECPLLLAIVHSSRNLDLTFLLAASSEVDTFGRVVPAF